MLTLSVQDRDRVSVLRQVQQGLLRPAEGARRLELSTRQFRRLRRRFQMEGDAAVIHRNRGRRSNRRVSDEVRTRALVMARLPLYRDFAPTLLSEHLARDPAIGVVAASTLRRWLIEEQLWEARPRRVRHRRRRERRPAYGELVLMDTSVHDWLEGRSSESMVLIALIDDATSRLVARFVPRDTGAANRLLIVDYLRTHGRFGALYTDRASHFGNRRRTATRGTTLEEREAEATSSLIRRALAALGSELILALSPQAKGRVERLFGTLQDRLIKEMRVAGIDSLDQANRFLDQVFLPFWNERFTVEPAEPLDAHRTLPDELDLDVLFAETEERVVRNDFTFKFGSLHWQLEATDAADLVPKQRITIEHRLDGSTRFRWRDRYLTPTPLHERAPTPKPKPTPHHPPTGRSHPAPANHPWRKHGFLVGKALHGPTPQVVASAPAALRPDTPSEEERQIA